VDMTWQEAVDIYKGQKKESKADPNLPVDYADWNEAMAFCKAVSAKTGKWVTLSTEAQWEYACRAGTTTAYFFGDDIKGLDEYAWHVGNDKTHPAGVMPVGLKKPNPWSLYDILGNAGEWVYDYMPILPPAATVDPQSPIVGRHYRERGVRGGYWGGYKDDAAAKEMYRSDNRLGINPDYKMDIINKWKNRCAGTGFRVIVALEKPVKAVDTAAPIGPTTAVAHQEEVFPIVGWGMAPFSQTNDRTVKDMADCGLNMMAAGEDGTYLQNTRVLDLCLKHGMKYMPSEKGYFWDEVRGEGYPGDWPKSEWPKRAQQVVEDYASHPALGGYFLYDEPGHNKFYALADMVKFLREKDPVHPAYINLLPTDTGLIAIDTTEHYYEKFVKMVKPRILSYDNYKYADPNSNFFYNMSLIRGHSVANDIPFWGFALTEDKKSPEELESCFAFEIYSLLSYGAKGIQYFLYWSRAATNESMVDLDGKKKPSYFAAQKINAEVKALGPTLLKLTSTAVYHVGPMSKGCVALDPNNGLVAAVAGAKVIVGLFKDPGGVNYAMIVNKDFKEPCKAKVTVGPAVTQVEAFNCATGNWEAAAIGPAKDSELALAAGRGKLFRLSGSSR